MRTYKRKTQRGVTKADVMLRAAKAVKLNGRSIRGTADDFNIPEATLRRFCRKVTDAEIHGVAVEPTTHVGYKRNRQVSDYAT